MPVEGIPEKDWTPWQREQVRYWKGAWSREDQWLRIEKRKIRQQHSPDWICLADIADWCARRPGDIERDPRRRMQAYCDLQESILLGEFSKRGRLKVIYLEPQPPSLRDRVRLRLNADHFRAHPGRVLDHVLDLCWAPRELCLCWLLARHIDPPPWLWAGPVRIRPAQLHEPSKAVATAAARSLSRANKDRTHAAIDAVYAAATGKPPNLKELVPLVRAELRKTKETATYKEIGYYAKDERHAGKRRPRRRTLKSERTSRLDS
jgi:hypothetical protein